MLIMVALPASLIPAAVLCELRGGETVDQNLVRSSVSVQRQLTILHRRSGPGIATRAIDHTWVESYWCCLTDVGSTVEYVERPLE